MGTAALFASDVIPSTNCTNYDTVELSLFSSIDQTASELEFYLDNTAACVSALDTMSIGAITKDAWTRTALTMTNPETDLLIISIGIGQATDIDVGACTIWVDDVRILKASSRVYKTLHPSCWGVVPGSTDYLKLTSEGLGIVGDNTLLRITGYDIPALMTADTGTSEVDPNWIIHQVCAWIMLSHAKSNQLDIDDRLTKGAVHQAEADKIRPRLGTQLHENTRML